MKNLQQCLKDSENMLYFFCRNVLHVQMFSLEEQPNLGVKTKPARGADSPFTPLRLLIPAVAAAYLHQRVEELLKLAPVPSPETRRIHLH